MTLLNKVAATIAARATWKRAILLFIFTYAVYFCMLGVTIPAVEEYTNGMIIFDLNPLGYTFSYAAALIDTLGEEGISVYLTRQLPLDFLYPGLMGLTGAVIIALLVSNRTRYGPYLICLPLAAGLTDYLENITIVTMLRQSPEPHIWTASAASLFTIAKSVLSSAYYIALTLLLVMRFIDYIKQKSGGRIGQ
jgi:hypothetical protein